MLMWTVSIPFPNSFSFVSITKTKNNEAYRLYQGYKYVFDFHTVHTTTHAIHNIFCLDVGDCLIILSPILINNFDI